MQKNGYLDFHSHILPGVDDGARDMRMTKQMLEKMYEEGITTVLATSHSYPGRLSFSVEDLRMMTKQVDDLAKEISPDMHVFAGQELYYRDTLVNELKQESVLTLAGTNYILVEFHPKETYERIYKAVKEFVENGYWPVIAHVERVESLIRNKEHIEELVEMSCYIQVNTTSLKGGIFDQRAKVLRSLVNEGLVHFIGTDSHNLESRPPRMRACVEQLYRKSSREQVEQFIYKNQQTFLRNEQIHMRLKKRTSETRESQTNETNRGNNELAAYSLYI